jgi:DNA replication protein DnaC
LRVSRRIEAWLHKKSLARIGERYVAYARTILARIAHRRARKPPVKRQQSPNKRGKVSVQKVFGLPEFEELETLEFISQNENIILIGTQGAGKTHYGIALGIAACMSGKSVFYANVPNLVTELKETMSKNQITWFRRKFERYSLVILDELGYISFDKTAADLLYNLISARNDKGSIIVTSNLTFDRWEEIFHDPTLTAAVVDRLAHKAHILDISREKGGRFEETIIWLEQRKRKCENLTVHGGRNYEQI